MLAKEEMTPEIIAGVIIGRDGNDCYITTTVALIEMDRRYVLLVTEHVQGWCHNEDAWIEWSGSNKEEGVKQYNDFVKKVSR